MQQVLLCWRLIKVLMNVAEVLPALIVNCLEVWRIKLNGSICDVLSVFDVCLASESWVVLFGYWCLAQQHKSQFQQLVEAARKNRAGNLRKREPVGDVIDEETTSHIGQSSLTSSLVRWTCDSDDSNEVSLPASQCVKTSNNNDDATTDYNLTTDIGNSIAALHSLWRTLM